MRLFAKPQPPLAYHRVRADDVFWSSHWSRQSLDHLLAVAETSELTRFIEEHARPGDRMLEAGCGLGQYVRYFSQRGVDVIGVDFSEDAIATHRRTFPDSDVRVADLTCLPFADSSFDVYLSLGVIEHYQDDATEILAEARRVLDDGGVLILSTPYLNFSRRLLRARIERRERDVARSGGEFFQYAFDEETLDTILSEADFMVLSRRYYDPGRGARDVVRLVKPASPPRRGRTDDGGRPAPRAHTLLKRTVLYSRPALKALAHMQLVAAKKRGS